MGFLTSLFTRSTCHTFLYHFLIIFDKVSLNISQSEWDHCLVITICWYCVWNSTPDHTPLLWTSVNIKNVCFFSCVIDLTSSYNMRIWTGNAGQNFFGIGSFNWAPALDPDLGKLLETVSVQSMTSPIYWGFSIFFDTASSSQSQCQSPTSCWFKSTKSFLMLKQESASVPVFVTRVLITFVSWILLQVPIDLDSYCLSYRCRTYVFVECFFFVVLYFPPTKAKREDTTVGSLHHWQNWLWDNSDDRCRCRQGHIHVTAGHLP